MANLTEWTIALVQEYRGWSLPIVFLLAFSESFAFVSLAVPATGILLGIGGLIGAARIAFWPIWLAAALGAIAGDWASYELALRFKERILHMRVFSTRPELIRRGIEFFRRWGIVAVFVGRFFGPFRAIVPLTSLRRCFGQQEFWRRGSSPCNGLLADLTHEHEWIAPRPQHWPPGGRPL